MSDKKILAIIPAYCEATKITPVITAIKDQGCDVLVIDDCSSDDTAAVARLAGASVVSHPINMGYGVALQTGYLFASENGYDIVVQLDADGQHEPQDIPVVLAPILDNQADVVFGSRFLGGRSNYPVPFARRVGQKLFGNIAGAITGKTPSDPTTGYQAMTASVVTAYCSDLFPGDYPDADMFVLLNRMGFRTQDVSVRMYSNDDTSMHSGIFKPLYYIYKMTLAIFMARFRTLPRKKDGA